MTTDRRSLRHSLGRARRRTARRLLNRPRVSVIVPTYNWATVLPYSIGSALDQTMADLEVLVIGDGCTDDSERVVRDVGDPRVRWHNLPENTGNQAGPNNEGLRQARGEFVAYLGHDDLWLPQHLELLTRVVEDGAPFAFGRQLRVDPGRAPYVWRPEWQRFAADQWLSPTAVVHRRESAERVGGWRSPNECGITDPETDLWTRYLEQLGPPFGIAAVTSVKLPAVLRRGVYRERPCDEQQVWLGRIRASPDSETLVREACAQGDTEDGSRYPLGAVPPEFLGKAAATALERQRLGRAFKGLD